MENLVAREWLGKLYARLLGWLKLQTVDNIWDDMRYICSVYGFFLANYDKKAMFFS